MKPVKEPPAVKNPRNVTALIDGLPAFYWEIEFAIASALQERGLTRDLRKIAN